MNDKPTLRSLRKRAGLTQEELGKLVDLKQAHVGAIERGAGGTTSTTLRKIAAVLGIAPATAMRLHAEAVQSYSPPSRPLVVLSSGERVGDSPKEQT